MIFTLSRPDMPKISPIPCLLLLICASLAHAAERVACHVDYGGETRTLYAEAVDSPYRVPAAQIGSYFLFRAVFERTTAIKIYTYADLNDRPTLIHQATHPYPPQSHSVRPFGFTGRHAVYEPMRDGELQYWCELEEQS